MMSPSTVVGNEQESNSECSLQMQCVHKKRKVCSEGNLRDSDQQSIHADMQRLQAPVFNIHIHVPPYKGDGLKMFLPKIQPVIHLHFDELGRKLEIGREEQDQETTYRAFQNLLAMTTPKFGNVKFHYQDASAETVREQEIDRTTQCSSRSFSNDLDVNVVTYSETTRSLESLNSAVTDCCGNCNSCADLSPRNSKISEEALKRKLYKKYNLKEPVVMLTDIRKTKYYKYMVSAGYIRDIEYDESANESTSSLEQLENSRQEIYKFLGIESVKKEVESYSPEAVSPKSSQTTGVLNPMCSASYTTVRLKNNESVSGAVGNGDKTLSTLAEGCNFSEILNRFQFNSEDSVKCSENKLNYAFNNEAECNYDSVESNSDMSFPSGVNFKERDSICESTADTENNPAFEEYSENVVAVNRKNHLSLSSNKYTSDGVTCLYPSNKFNDSESDSDDSDVISDIQTTSKEVTSDSEVEVFSSEKASHAPHMNDLKLFQNRGSKLINLGIAGLQLELIRKEMKARRLHDNNRKKRKGSKSKSTDTGSSSSNASHSPKKMKRSNDAPKKSHIKTRTPSRMEDYIPLQASGPTKFAVTPLNKVNPFESHNARNFKKEMLFGNRVNRFSTPDYLRIYQLKQKAAKTQSK